MPATTLLGYQGGMTRRPHHPGGFGPGYGHGFSPGERTARRVRRAADRRSSPSFRHGGPPLRPGMAVPSPWIALPLIVLLIGALSSAAAFAAFAAVSFSPLFLLAVIAITAHRAGRRRVGPPPPAAAPRVAPPPWNRARERFDALRVEYTAFECDAMAVLRLPALADVSVPSTGRFVEAFAEAQALDTDARPEDRDHAAAFVAAVDRAVRAWEAAKDAAERIRHSTLSSSERSSVERAIKLLTTARDSDNDAERHAAYAMARSELAKLEKAGVLHLPRAATLALENDGRGHLPA
jgi:ribosomal protein S20